MTIGQRLAEIIRASRAGALSSTVNLSAGPGIMLAGAVRTFVNRYGVTPGTRAVVITACDEAYRAALDLHAAGIYIALIADVRAHADGPLVAEARHADVSRPAVCRSARFSKRGRVFLHHRKFLQRA